MTISQQAFLRDAMRRLNLTRDVFATRIGVKRRALDTWLLPEGSQEFRAMPEVVQRFVSEIVQNGVLLEKYTQSVQDGPLRDRIAVEGKHQLVSVDQFTRESVEDLFRVADMMQPIARRQKISRVLEGAVLGNLFFEASTRTRVLRLGLLPPGRLGLLTPPASRSRPWPGRIHLRHQPRHERLCRRDGDPSSRPGLGGRIRARHQHSGGQRRRRSGEHPSQALLDLYTILTEFSRLGKLLDGAHIAMVGDLKYGRTVHSLIKLLALYKGVKFSLVSPRGLEMPSYIIEQASRNGNVIEQKSSLGEGLAGADVIYATRVQKERFANEENEGYTPDFQINRAIIDEYCGPDTIVMHPLPRDSRPGANDLSVDLNHDPRLAIFRQTDNGIPIRMAIFAVLLGVEGLVQHSMRDVTWQHPPIGPDDSAFHGLD